MNLIFPDGFLWGAASSGPQSEGNFQKKHLNVMDHWYKTSPEDFFQQTGPDTASDFFHRYNEDFRLMKECGFNSFRTSVQWTRLIRDFETGEADPDGVSFYRSLISAAKDSGIELILNLHHFDLPQELLDAYGGWQSRHVAELFVRYARTAFELFGRDVTRWTTFNEPMVIAEAGYLDGFHWPKYQNQGKQAVQVMYHMALASALAIHEFRTLCPDGLIGTVLNLTPAYPASDSKADRDAAFFAEQFYNRFFLDTAVKGTVPEQLFQLLKDNQVLFSFAEGDEIILKQNTVDFLGVNYYHPRRVKAPDPFGTYTAWNPRQYFSDYEKPDARINPYRGWEIYPPAIGDIAKILQEEYGNIPWYISENGMGVENEERFIGDDGIIHDDYRIEFYKEHLTELHKAIEQGSRCFGFHAWTAFDCWSWNNAYKNRYGFIAVDLSTLKRTIKQSGHWFKTVAEANGFSAEEE